MPLTEAEELELLELEAAEAASNSAASEAEVPRAAEFRPDSVLETSKAESAARGFVEGVPFTRDVAPIVEKGIALVSDVTGIGPQDVAQRVLDKPVSELKEENRLETEEARAANPEIFGASKFVGATAPAVAAAPFMSPMAAGALTGAAAGASEGQGIMDRASKAVVGGTLGAAMGKGGELLSKFGRSGTAEKVDEMAEGMFRRTLGFRKPSITRAGGVEDATDVARTLKEAGVGSRGLAPQQLASQIDELAASSGDELGRAYAALPTDKTVPAHAVMRRVWDEALLPLTQTPNINATKINQVNQVLRDIAEMTGNELDQPMTLPKLWELTQAVGKRAWEKGVMNENLAPYQEAWKSLKGILEEAAQGANPKLADHISRMNRLYSAATQGAKALDDRLASEASSTGGLFGMAKQKLNELGERFVNRGLQTSVNVLGPVEKLLQVPGKLGRFEEPLRAAAQRGPAALSSTWFVMSQQHPELREMAFGEDNDVNIDTSDVSYADE